MFYRVAWTDALDRLLHRRAFANVRVMLRVHANLHRLARWVRTDYLDIYQQCTSSPAIAFRWRILRHCQATRSTNLLPAGVMFCLEPTRMAFN
jgi:hypothetical protein